MLRRKQLDFTFHFDKEDRIYEVGERVYGSVQLHALRDINCHGISLELQWRTHGKGNTARGDVIDLAVDFDELSLRAQQRYSIPFDFSAPSGPLTYHGHLLKVDWYLRCTVDVPIVPDFLDPREETEILLLPKEGVTVDQGDVTLSTLQASDGIGTKSGNFGSLVIAGTLAFIAITILNVARNFSSGIAVIPILIAVTMFTTAGLIIYQRIIRSRQMREKLGEVVNTIEPRTAVPGETLQIKLAISPQEATKINAISFHIKAEEVVISGSSTNKSTYRHTLFQNHHHVESPVLDVGKTHHFDANFTIPFDAPYSFKASNNNLHWHIETIIEVEGWPNWRQHQAFLVVPWRASM